MQERILQDILSTLQAINKSMAEINGKFEAHTLTTYGEILELKGEIKKVTNELSKQTLALNTLAEEVIVYEEPRHKRN